MPSTCCSRARASLAYFVAIALQLKTDALWANLLLSAFMGHLLYVWFVLRHDCMHRTAFRTIGSIE